MLRSDYSVIKNLMNKDGSLDSAIYELQCELKRDLTEDEEEAIICETVKECKERCLELSCDIAYAYNDIMY